MIDYERAERDAERLLLMSMRPQQPEERLANCCATRLLAAVALLEFAVIIAGAFWMF